MKIITLILEIFVVTTFSFAVYKCTPNPGDTLGECSEKFEYCSSKHSPMKFTVPFKCLPNGKRPIKKDPNPLVFHRQDSGCQCKNYCGYKCKYTCNLNKPLCKWNSKKQACYYAGSNVKGHPISYCGFPILIQKTNSPSMTK